MVMMMMMTLVVSMLMMMVIVMTTNITTIAMTMMIPSASARRASGPQCTRRSSALGEQTGSGIDGTPSRSCEDGSASSNLIESSEREIVKDGNGEVTFSGRHGRARENNTRCSREFGPTPRQGTQMIGGSGG
eukprot:6765179-Pyramimonas_sp.AAC.1